VRGQHPKETARNQAIVWLLLESGLRRFELSALDTDDIDLSGKTVTVRRGKNGKARVAVFGDDTRKALWQWLRRRGATPGALFLSRVGDRLTPNGVSQLLARIGHRAGIQLRPHLFRHSWAHHLLSGGINEHDLMTLAGWSSPKMLSVYGAGMAQERALAAGRVLQVGNLIKRSTGAATSTGSRHASARWPWPSSPVSTPGR
jgi:integrase/recombinase XerC